MSEQKPREWTVQHTAGHGWMVGYTGEFPPEREYKLIEYSAYEAVVNKYSECADKYLISANKVLEQTGEIIKLKELADRLASALKVHHTIPGYSEVLADYDKFKGEK